MKILLAALAVLLPAAGAPALAQDAVAPAGAISVLDQGAFCDGASHPLSARFATLAQARATYPFVTALSGESDWAALQAAVNLAQSPRWR